MCTIYWLRKSQSGSSTVDKNNLFKTIERFERIGYTVTGFEIN